MSTPRDIAVVVGSLRKESFNRKMALAIAQLAPPSLKLEIVEIGQLALYNQDDEADPPPRQWRRSARGSSGRCGAVRHARIQPLGARRAEERDRRRLASLRQERVGRQAGRGDQRVAGRDRRIRRQPSPAPVAGVPQHAGAAAARGLHRPARRPVRRRTASSPTSRRASSSASSSTRSRTWIERNAAQKYVRASARELADHARAPRRSRARRRPISPRAARSRAGDARAAAAPARRAPTAPPHTCVRMSMQ